jgi:Domain of unknown function (DUF4337)
VGRETLEPHELAELEEEGRSPISTRVTLTVAILAVLASISAFQGERTAAESILSKNEAVLAQSRASDEWAFRQAKSIKLHLQEMASGHESGDSNGQRAEITASEERARAAERQRDEANQEATERYLQHRRFAVGTNLFQIAIVLETVAAVLGRPMLWWGGIAVGTMGVLALVNGFVMIV